MNAMLKNTKWMKTSLGAALLAATMIFGAELMNPASAEADVRIDARIRTPQVDVRLRSHPKPMPRPVVVNHHRQRPIVVKPAPRWAVKKHPRPVFVGQNLYLTKADKQVAKRLSRLTGVRKERIMNMRARGLSWRQIGQRLDISPRVVRAAMSKQAMRNYLAHNGGHLEVCWSEYDD